MASSDNCSSSKSVSMAVAKLAQQRLPIDTIPPRMVIWFYLIKLLMGTQFMVKATNAPGGCVKGMPRVSLECVQPRLCIEVYVEVC